MDQNDSLGEIRRRAVSNDYSLRPAGDSSAKEDVLHLLSVIEQLTRRVEDLEKKNKALSQHALELTQEMENIRADFEGGNFR